MAIELISKIKPKNNGSFALVDATDVEMANGERVETKIGNLGKDIEDINTFLVGEVTTIEENISVYKTIANTLINADGSFFSQNNYRICCYSLDEKFDTIKIKGACVANKNIFARYAFYTDVNGTDLVMIGSLNAGGWSDSYEEILEIPFGSKFLLVGGQNISDSVVTGIESIHSSGVATQNWVERKKYINEEYFNDNISKVGLTKRKTIQYTSSVGNKYLDTNGNFQTLANYTIYKVPINVGDELVIKGSCKSNQSTCMRYGFYADIDGTNLIKQGTLNIGGWSDTYSDNVIVPSGASYLLCCCNTGNPMQVIKEEKVTSLSWLYGKKMGVCGDSMSAGNGTYKNNCWAERVAIRNNMELNNQAINGSFLTHADYDSSVIGGQISKLPSDLDIVVIYSGTNDITSKVPIGEEDSTDTNTLCGTMNTIIPLLKDTYPKAQIVFITPYRRYESEDEVTFTEVWSEQKNWILTLNKMCNKYGIPCFNNMIQGQIAFDNASQRASYVTNDSTHLNDEGIEFVSRLYENFLNNPFINTIVS